MLRVGAVALVLVALSCGGDSSTTGSGAGGSGAAGGLGGATNSGAGGVGLGGGAQGGGGFGGAAGGAGGEGGVDCTPATGGASPLVLTELIAGLVAPVFVTQAPGDDQSLYVVQQTGQILRWQNGVSTLFLDVDGTTDNVVAGAERGLLGLAFHPSYAQNGRFWVHYSAGPGLAPLVEGTTIVQEFARSTDDPLVADPMPAAAPLLRVAQPYPNHNGGSIEFSPVDGLLYIGLGDGGFGGDPMGNGQNQGTLLATLVRLDVSPTDGSYLIPPGNIADGAPEVFDWGLRNPYRMSFDACTGDRYIGDVGQGYWEEIDVAAATDGPQNWGWSCFEGNHDYGNGCMNPPVASPPATEYLHPAGEGRSVTGGYVYRGSAIPWLRGAYLYGDYITGQIWTLRWAGGAVLEEAELSDDLGTAGTLNISSFGQDLAGEVYVVHYNGSNGKVFRIDPE